MTQLVITAATTAAGAFVGSLAGNPLLGARLGFAAGAYLGGRYVNSQRKFEGPRLGAEEIISSSFGDAIPWLAGSGRVAVKVIWQSARREVSSSSRAGKGGGPTVTTYSYERDVLFLLIGIEAKDVARIWSNGKLVWSQLPDASIETVNASTESPMWRSITIYTGGPTQLPHPTYEAHVGVGNALAYRDMVTVGIDGLQLGTSGLIPNLMFEVVQQDFATLYFSAPMTSNAADVVAPTATITTTPTNAPTFSAAGAAFTMNGSAQNYVYDATASGKLDIVANDGVWQYTADAVVTLSGAAGTGDAIRFMVFGAGTTQVGFGYRTQSGVPLIYIYGVFNFTDVSFVTTTPFASGRYRILMDTRTPGSTVFTWQLDGVDIYTTTQSLTPTNFAWYGPANGDQRGVSGLTLTNCNILAAGVDTYDPAETLQAVVEKLCARAGMPAGTYDASALASITKPVRSLVISNFEPVRAALDQLMLTHFFGATVSDKLYFKPRATTAVLSIPLDDLAAAPNDASDQPLPITEAADLESMPQKLLRYCNVVDDYQDGSESSDRLVSGSVSQEVVEVGLGMTASEAKAVVDAMAIDAVCQMTGTTIALPLQYAALEPGDVVDVDGLRVRLGRKQDANGVLTFEAVRHDSSAIVSAGTTDGSYTPSSQVTRPGDTVFLGLDIPLLRDADDGPGYYVTAKGSTTVWPGGQIHSSADNVTFASAAEVNESAVFGTCTTTLGNFTGVGVDESNTLTVNVGNGTLASSTRDALFADETVNAALVGDEVIRFVRVTMVSAGVYTLSGLLRGQKGTESFISTHGASERFVLLTARGMRNVSQQISENGLLRYLKSITLGATAFRNPTTLTNTNRRLKPLAPAAVRGTAVAGQNLLLTWQRRSRLSSRFLATSGVPLGEAVEAYTVRIYSGSTLKRTLSATSQSTTYTRAQQVADGVTASTGLRIDVTQVSAAVGEGYVGTGTTTGTAAVQAQQVAITLGGTFASGAVIRVLLGVTTTEYTVLVGDIDLDGAAASLAVAFDALTDYAATASGPVVTVTGPLSLPYAATAFIVPGDNIISAQQTQAAAAASAGSAFTANLFVAQSLTGVTEPVPAGTTFTVRYLQGGAQYASITYTTVGGESLASVHGGLSNAAFANSTLQARGIGYQTTSVSGVSAGYVACPVGEVGHDLSTSATSPWGLGVSIQSIGVAAVPSALPQIITITLSGTATAGYVYRATLGGVAYTYTAVGGDTMTDVATGLAAAIDAAAAYIATSSGAVVTVTAATVATPFTFAADIVASTITVSSATIQGAS